jgi:hypothetical protein
LFFVLVSTRAFSQMNIAENDELMYQHILHFGVEIGYNTSNFKVTLSNVYTTTSLVKTAESYNGPGFTLGIVSDLRLARYFDLRFVPDLSFGDKSLHFITPDSTVIKDIQSTYLDLPVNLKYKSAPYKDMRMYVFCGGAYSIDFESNARARLAQNLVQISPDDISLEYGFGMEFHLPLVVISPEIKFSYGLINELTPNNALIYSAVMQGLRIRTVLFSLHFEG